MTTVLGVFVALACISLAARIALRLAWRRRYRRTMLVRLEVPN